MQKILEIIQRKPPHYILIGLVYLLAVGMLKWHLVPPVDSLWFLGGGILGIFFLDAAEVFFNIRPSPFRSIIFVALFALVSFFVVSSSASFLARGMILTLYITLLLLQIDEYRKCGNLESWYKMVSGAVSLGTQQLFLVAFGFVFFVETYMFIR